MGTARNLNENSDLSFTVSEHPQLLQHELLITTEHCTRHGKPFSILTGKLTQTDNTKRIMSGF